MTGPVHLADINVLIALVEGGHSRHSVARQWFDARSAQGTDLGAWATCLLTEAGFLRIMTNPRLGGHRLEEAMNTLKILTENPGHQFWPIVEGWSALSAPFTERLFGHQQVTDACLLGLAVRGNGVLVTMDKGIQYLAGDKYGRNVLVLD